ncbi:hypothetical protein BD414DRAFT_581098 [Trametes punicea]|nr:hypothetical protein BD414DRAFT_581098 [Trametes punicea]
MSEELDWPCALNEYCQKNKLTMRWGEATQVPSESGNARAIPTWTIPVFVNDVQYGLGYGTSKGKAKFSAAEVALRALWAKRGDQS